MKECNDCESVDKPGWEMPCKVCNGGKDYERAIGLSTKVLFEDEYHRCNTCVAADAPKKACFTGGGCFKKNKVIKKDGLGITNLPSFKAGQPAESNNPFNRQIGGNHYKKEGLPDVTEWCMRHEMDIGEFNVIKYTFRHEKKNGIEDLRKAQHYLEFIAWIKYGEAL